MIPIIRGYAHWTEACEKTLDDDGWLGDETMNFAMQYSSLGACRLTFPGDSS